MKNAVYGLAVVVALAGVSVGAASAANHEGLPGIIEKLEEVKTAILGLDLSVDEPLDVNVLNQATSSIEFPNELDVNIVSPDAFDVNIVSGGGGDASKGYLAETLLDGEPIAPGDEFVLDVADAISDLGRASNEGPLVAIWSIRFFRSPAAR